MRIQILITLLLFLLPLSASAVTVEYSCIVHAERNGESITIDTPGLKVLEYNENYEFVQFDTDDDTRITAVLCKRSSVIPSKYDYKVVAAGYVLYLADDNRVAALEVREDVYSLRLVKGDPFTTDELKEIDSALSLANGHDKKSLTTQSR